MKTFENSAYNWFLEPKSGPKGSPEDKTLLIDTAPQNNQTLIKNHEIFNVNFEKLVLGSKRKNFRQNKGSYLESIVEANTKRKIMV